MKIDQKMNYVNLLVKYNLSGYQDVTEYDAIVKLIEKKVRKGTRTKTIVNFILKYIKGTCLYNKKDEMVKDFNEIRNAA